MFTDGLCDSGHLLDGDSRFDALCCCGGGAARPCCPAIAEHAAGDLPPSLPHPPTPRGVACGARVAA
jgi:hypothetical protein